MKTLIFNGSPRPHGNTSALIEELVRHLEGEVKIIRAYDCDIKPCVDCRFCWKNEGCATQDGMQEVYDYIQECDNVVVASPLQFLELSGQLLVVLSRLQTYWCGELFRKVTPVPKKKRGGIIIVRGGEGYLKKPVDTAKTLLRHMNARADRVIFSDKTDETPSIEQADAVAGIEELARVLNRQPYVSAK